jgi:hypothetical protein
LQGSPFCIAPVFHRMGQQCWLEEHRRQSHVIRIGDRWPDTLATHPPASLKVACVQIKSEHGLRSSTARRSTSTQRQRHEPSRETLAAFACGQICAKKRPRRGRRAEAACVGTPAGVGQGGQAGPAEILAPGYEIGRAFSRYVSWFWVGASARVVYCGRPR